MKDNLATGIREVMSQDEIRKCLDDIPNNKVDWNWWNTIGMRVFAACEGEDYGLEEWQKWSAKNPKDGTGDNCADRWATLHTSPPTRTGAGALVNTAREALGNPNWFPVVSVAVTAAGALALAPALAAWNAAELKVSFANIPHRQWLYGTYLIRGEITVLAAPGGVGKTALATGIAVEIATGNEKLGEKVWRSDDQKVLYLNGEDSCTEIKRRLCAFCRQHQITEQNLDRLYVAGADDPRVQSLSFLSVNGKGATVLNDAGFGVLESALQSLHPDVLVLDPLVVFCGGGNMNDNAIMSLVMRKLKALAVKNNCAILIVHHTRKGGKGSDLGSEAEAISGAAAIVNLARRALMPLTMAVDEVKAFSVLPSQRLQYFKLVDAKSNLAPLSAEAPWYELVSEELFNAEPPTYPHGDRVQAIKRAQLTRSKVLSFAGPEQQTIRFEILKLIDRRLTIDGEKVPYSPNSTGNNKKRAILDDAMAAVEQASEDREWLPRDLRAVVERELEALKHDGWIIVEPIEKGRFRRGHGLQAIWERTPWAEERENLHQHGGPTVRTEEEEQELERIDREKMLPGGNIARISHGENLH
jgi:hypothetical protein